jgi:hypothetical protein
LTTSGRRFLALRRFGLLTVPSLQPAAIKAAFAEASFLPASLGTMQEGGGACRWV